MTTLNPISRRWKYGALLRMSLQDALAYRGSMIASWLINAWSVLVMLYVWGTVFGAGAAGATATIGAFDWDAMRTYLVIAHALQFFTNNGVSWVVSSAVRNGDIVSDLTRPIDFLAAKLMGELGGALFNIVIGGVLVIGLSLLFFHLQPPATPAAAVFFALACALAFLVSFLINYMLGLSSCWLMNNQGISWIFWYGGRLLAGTVIPLSLFPGWLRTLAAYSPFQATVSTPLVIYLGQAQGGAAWQLLGVQVFWVLALYALARWLFPRAMRRLEIQGG